jgi:hypothetical protein
MSIRQLLDDEFVNMSKEQVFLALGYPSHLENFAPADGLTRETIFASNTSPASVNTCACAWIESSLAAP